MEEEEHKNIREQIPEDLLQPEEQGWGGGGVGRGGMKWRSLRYAVRRRGKCNEARKTEQRNVSKK